MRSRVRPRFEEALKSLAPLDALREELRGLLDEGWSREALLRRLGEGS